MTFQGTPPSAPSAAAGPGARPVAGGETDARSENNELLVPVVEDARGRAHEAAHDHDPGADPDKPPVRMRDHRGSAQGKADDDDRDRHPGGAPAMVRLVPIWRAGQYVKPARASVSHGLRHGS